MVTGIAVALPADVPGLMASAEALVATDAGRYDPEGTDLGWAARSGSRYVAAIMDSDDSVALVARDADTVVGHLVAHLHGPGSVHPIRIAELESIHVFPDYRGRGVGTQLVDAFLVWAANRGAQRTSVTTYSANEAAQRFYARHGFVPESVILRRDVRP